MAKENGKLSAWDRAALQAVGDGRVFGRADDPACKQFPELWRWLSQVYLRGGFVKQPATITIRLGPEGALASLVDRDFANSIDVGFGHLADCFAALESALTAEVPPLRSWGKKEPKLRKRPKREN